MSVDTAPVPRALRGGRDLGVDVARFLALVSMYVAHCGPVPGPAGVFTLSEYLTMPLFALLVGVGAQLGEDRARRLGERGHWWRSLALRATVLILIGLALDHAGANIVIVLVYLGALTVIAAAVAFLPTLAVAGVGFASWVLSPLLMTHFRSMVPPQDGPGPWLENLFLTGPYYRVSGMIAYAALGILLTRWTRSRRGALMVGAAGMTLLMAAGVVLVLGRRGMVDVAPYTGTHVEIATNLLLTAGVFLVGGWLGVRLPPVLMAPLAWAGAMTLTLYSLQVVYLGWYVREVNPVDDNWPNVALLTVGSVVFAVVWHFVVRRTPWSRGPVEGLVAAVVR